MTIGFHNVCPAPLATVGDARTNIWGKEILFSPGLKYSVVAPSGKGKTTFVHLVYGLRFDFTGAITIDQDEVKSVGSDRWTAIRKDHISIVYQDLRLFLQLTALENIQVKATLYPGFEIEKIKAMAEQLQIVHVLSKPCHMLSYGERQRIAIIRALIQPFDWLILDEPFSHLDVENTKKAAGLIAADVLARKAGLIITSLGPNDFFSYDSKLEL